MLKSHYKPLVGVVLPGADTGRQFYMHPFDVANPEMPVGFEDYLAPVQALLAASGVKEGTAYLTVDEKLVKAGQTQRKPGPHVDGCYVQTPAPSPGYWGHSSFGSGSWNHSCNIIPKRMAVIVASNYSACRAWDGEFDAQPKGDGDLSHLALGEGEILPANVGYLLSPDCVHESLPMTKDTLRTFLRIALPVD